MSPELRNKLLDPENDTYHTNIKSDIFSIGMVLLKSICSLEEK